MKKQKEKIKTNFGTKRTEIYCHDCNSYFTVELDFDVNGNHEVKCPNCNHIHYRVIENGVVTGERYRSSMGMSYTYSTTSYSSNYSTGYDAAAYTGSTQSANSTSTYSGGGFASSWTSAY